MRIDQPPLRARGKDIELLAHHMLERFRGDARHRVRGFSTDAITALYKHDWPGNVRELINRVRRAVVMTEGRLITAQDLEPNTVSMRRRRRWPTSASRSSARRSKPPCCARAGVSRRRPALGVSRATLYRWMEAYGIERPRGTGPSD